MSCDGLCDDVLYSATIEMEAIAVRANVDFAGIISSESGGGVSLAFHSVDRVSCASPLSSAEWTPCRLCIDRRDVLCTDPDTPSDSRANFDGTK